MFGTVKELIELSKNNNKSIADIMIEQEILATNKTKEDIISLMTDNYKVMESAIESGIKGVKSYSGITGGDGKRMYDYIDEGNYLTDEIFLKAICYAISTNEVNAAMGVICATPTAGSAGVVPAVLFSLKEKLKLSEDDCINFLFTAGAFGYIIANNACISGAAGGCQAEVGSASGMAAAAAVIAKGGTGEQAAHALSISLKNMMGLVCDPVAGLVEVPCISRNAAGAVNALCAAEMALAGIKSVIPTDEVIEAMYQVGINMPVELRETALGGIATTKTGLEIKEKIFGCSKCK